jgi:hypothetical protein
MIFSAKLRDSGTKFIIKKGSHPPKKNRALRPDLRIILLYSARKKRAKPIAEYSTL